MHPSDPVTVRDPSKKLGKKTCKRTLVVIIGYSIATESVLKTALHDVMSYANFWPLTHLRIDPSDPEPLTPNHFLIWTSNALLSIETH